LVQAIFSVSKVYPNNTIKKISGKQNVGCEWGKGLLGPTCVSIQQAIRRFVARYTAITWYEYVICGLVKASTEETRYLYSHGPASRGSKGKSDGLGTMHFLSLWQTICICSCITW